MYHFPLPDKSYYMFHKPAGCITARTDDRHQTVMDYFDISDTSTLHPVGRLDKDTEGLLIVTDDGLFNHAIMFPDHQIVKTYEFYCLGNLTSDDIHQLEQGIFFTGSDKKTAPCKIHITNRTQLQYVLSDETYCLHVNSLSEAAGQRTSAAGQKILKNRPESPVTIGTISITEGRKHHVKRLIKHAGGCVFFLKRTSIGALQLDDTLTPGQYRPLTPDELTKVFQPHCARPEQNVIM